VETEFYHADGGTDRQTDMAKLIVAFRNFPKAPKRYLEAEHGVRIFLFTVCLTKL